MQHARQAAATQQSVRGDCSTATVYSWAAGLPLRMSCCGRQHSCTGRPQ